ncbi:MAG: DUF1559 domain-containing protein [Isosphaeraceae bacterium]|nr:DUF1559 domain-containing protein [Isosphaeraceae bacterium]
MVIRDQRRGFKLIDLMVSILVIAVLLALLVPFLGDSGLRGSRTQCVNHMRQLGLGLIQFETCNNHFPNAGTFRDDPEAHQGDPKRSNLYRAVVDPAAFASETNPCLYNWVVEILPYLNYPALANAWNKSLPYDSNATSRANEPPNQRISSSTIGILRCPNDFSTRQANSGLSYVVNGGFVRWPAVPVGWVGSAKDGQSRNGPVLQWTPEGSGWRASLAVGHKLGVMFLGTESGAAPWDIRCRSADIADGQSNTIQLGENTLAGYSAGNAYSGGLVTNWACPLPNFCMFIASDDVCESGGSSTNCLAGQLRPTALGMTGAGWVQANRPDGPESINFASMLKAKGSFPFLNSGHGGLVNVVMCDGSTKSLRDTIDGKIYAELMTPAGTTLPATLRQSQPPYDETAP